VCVFVAEASGEVVGYVLGYDRRRHPAYADAPTAEVEVIMVADQFRCRGIGSFLLHSFEGWARTKQCRRVVIGGAPAAGFYHSVGYVKSRFAGGLALEKAL
jgi:GNAT superfamily N-acetyltransferase